MKHFPTTAAVALSALLTLPAHAATFDWWRNAEPDSYGLKIAGEIVKGDFELFKRTLLAADPHYWGGRIVFTVRLDSPGGSVVEAIGIGNVIRIFGFNTFVADGARCASACGLIWLAGERRYLGSRTAVGFHMVFDPKTRQPIPAARTMVEAYLAMLGVSQPTIRYFLQAPPESIEWLTPDKAREHGIADVWVCVRCSGAAPVPDSPNAAPPPWPRPVRTIPIKGDFPPIGRHRADGE
jgi:membrane-bound ClpP family serine protease